jgi:hypothetical protein
VKHTSVFSSPKCCGDPTIVPPTRIAIVVLGSASARKNYPDTLRRIRYYDAEQDRRIGFLTNNLDLPALIICQLYKSRWQVELFRSHDRLGW